MPPKKVAQDKVEGEPAKVEKQTKLFAKNEIAEETVKVVKNKSKQFNEGPDAGKLLDSSSHTKLW
jgi:hypothetical protein